MKQEKGLRGDLRGFSLIELIVVIAITAVLLAVVLPNLLGARERARDAARKQEMNEMKTALRLYYNDWQSYPGAGSCSGGFNYIKGCGVNHLSCCPCATGVEFAVGTTCGTVYMKKFSTDFGSKIWYYKAANQDDFCLKASLENGADPDIATSQSRCGSSCTAAGSTCANTDYCVCAD